MTRRNMNVSLVSTFAFTINFRRLSRRQEHSMKNLLGLSVVCLVTQSPALAQGVVGGQIGFGGYYNRTSVSGAYGGATVTSYGYGGSITAGVSSGYGSGYGACYGSPYGYGAGCAPVYVPYSPFTRTYGNPCYPAAVVVPGSVCVVPVYPVACGQFIVR